MAASKAQIMIVVGVLFVCLYVDTRVYSMQCRSRTGGEVDWFAIYKLPKIPDIKNDPKLQKGVAYYYMDEKNPTLSLVEQPIDNLTDGNPLYSTLKPIYDTSLTGSFSYVIYNDQPPDHSASESHGHTKGVLGFNKQTGFWLVHSHPKFPPDVATGLRFRRNLNNGQTYLCVSLNYRDIDNKIGTIFRYNFPYVYDKALPPEFKDDNPILQALLYKPRRDDKHVVEPPWQNVIKLPTIGEEVFLAFAKFRNFGKDLYDGFLSENLRADILVQTWRSTVKKKGDKLPSNCSIPFKVYNIQNIKFEYKDKKIEFQTAKDHSKWAVSKTVDNWLCIGDINRSKTQFLRPGGQVCFQNKHSWKSFRELVATYNDC